VELFEQIRREYEHGVGTIQGVARKFGVHRRMVREAIDSAVPRPRKKAEREKPKMAVVIPWIEEILEADQKAPRKQRHTAHRIWCRLKLERPEAAVGESTVRQYVRKRKIELCLEHGEVFVPQTYHWGQEGQVDWYEAWAEVDGEQVKAYVFCLRSMASGGAFHRAYPHASQQAFLEAHELAFAYFGGVFRVLRLDNLKSAVKQILRGHQREETERFIAFRSHWGFESEFCTPGEGHEKGGVEGENGYYRRNHLVPLPKAKAVMTIQFADIIGALRATPQILQHKPSAVEVMDAHVSPCPADSGRAFLNRLQTELPQSRSILLGVERVPDIRPLAATEVLPGDARDVLGGREIYRRSGAALGRDRKRQRQRREHPEQARGSQHHARTDDARMHGVCRDARTGEPTGELTGEHEHEELRGRIGAEDGEPLLALEVVPKTRWKRWKHSCHHVYNARF